MDREVVESLLGFHCLFGYVLLFALPASAVYLLIRYRLGRTLNALDRLILVLLQLLLLVQVYMGVIQLHLRKQQDVWHYTFGFAALLLFAAIYWLFPRWRERWMLVASLALLGAGGLVLLAIFRT